MSATRGNLTSVRRTSPEDQTSRPERSGPRTALRFGRFTLLPDEGRLLADGVDIPLPPKPFETLHYLLSHPGRVVGKQELLDAVWPGTFITDDGLVQCVVDIRRALGDSAKAPSFIQTVPKRGYRMVADVTREEIGAGRPAAHSQRTTEPGDASSVASLDELGLSPAPPSVHPGRHLQWLAIAAGLAVLALVAVVFWRSRAESPLPVTFTPEPGLVLLLPLQMVEGLEDLAWLRTGLLDVIAAEMTRSHASRLVPRHRLESAMERAGLKGVPILSGEQGLAIARELGAERLVRPSIQRIDERFVLEAGIVDVASGVQQREVSIHGDRRSNLLDALGRFSQELAEQLGVAEAGTAIAAGAITTKSLAAYRAYSEALDQEGRGGRDESAEAEAKLMQAVELDPAFARAYVRLALVQQSRRRWGYSHSDPRPAVAAAHKLTDELPERERLIVEGLAHLLLERDSARALESWHTLLRVYPGFAQEAGVPTLIADALMQQGNWGQIILRTAAYADAAAVPRAERALLHSLLGKAFRKQGEFARAIAHVNRAIDLWPTREGPALLRVRTMLGRFLVDAGRAGEAVGIFREVAADAGADAGIVTDAGWGFYMAGRREEARALVQRALAMDAAYGNAYHLRGWLQLTGGHPREAAGDFEEAYARTPVGFGVPEQGLIVGDLAALYYAGVARSRAGDRAGAAKTWRRVYGMSDAARRAQVETSKASPMTRWHASYYAALAAARLGMTAPSPGRLEGDDATYFLLLARLEAVRQHPAAALDALRQAVALGVGDLQHVADDPNFENLAGDALFRELLRGSTR